MKTKLVSVIFSPGYDLALNLTFIQGLNASIAFTVIVTLVLMTHRKLLVWTLLLCNPACRYSAGQAREGIVQPAGRSGLEN